MKADVKNSIDSNTKIKSFIINSRSEIDSYILYYTVWQNTALDVDQNCHRRILGNTVLIKQRINDWKIQKWKIKKNL